MNESFSGFTVVKKSGEKELILEDYELVNKAETPLPIDLVQDTTQLDKRLDYRFLDLRKPRNLLIFKIITYLQGAMRSFFIEEGFIEMNSPKLMASASESGSELFKVDYFGKKAYLAQSPQFYKQMAMSAGFEKVFEIAPAFRANPSHTTRHDTEFTMVDVEISWISSFEDLLKFEERWLQFCFKEIKDKFGKEIKSMFNVEINVPEIPFPRITMEETHKILKNSYDKKFDKDDDLDPSGEKFICDYVKKKYNHEFAFITKFPWKIRPFYHMRPEDKSLTESFDLLFKGLEITTGAQREHRLKILEEQAKEKGIKLKEIDYYLDFFRYGCPPHGGFALSPTRVVMSMLNLGNVREATYLPRDTERLTP